MSLSAPATSSRTKPKTRILRDVTVAIAGHLGSGWSDADVARWTAYNGGRFVATMTPDNEQGVTHLLCSREEYAKPKKQRCANLKLALEAKTVRILLRDWLEDSLHRRRRRPERNYLLTTVARRDAAHAAAPTTSARQERLAALRERGRREGEAFVDSSLYRLYRDSTGFAYRVTLRRDHAAAGVWGERYVLHLFESFAQPPLYWFAARHYKSRTHTQPRTFRPSATCQLFGTAFGQFCGFFHKKTGVA
ncbi:hypothetical protein HMPREF1624_06321 [Sporothrix schenckii ATCC 58251]|uniref:BRCT domain-containing protein n=1 Tax=Sporothrix schenckii (strain ATCC 58251 / de Perez 2211183) TaxID=1391915 RepID=U7PQI9_SPOS1|nr:hypothetical protein HMPREF1624_06321 [Sporothrix schenckii ATCC 58251]